MTTEERIAQLEAEIEALNARLPKHSVPPSMIIELEDLEDQLVALKHGLREQEKESRRAAGSLASDAPHATAPEAQERLNES